jgi:hypothetical protein
VNFDSVKVRGVTFVTVTVTKAAIVRQLYFAMIMNHRFNVQTFTSQCGVSLMKTFPYQVACKANRTSKRNPEPLLGLSIWLDR